MPRDALAGLTRLREREERATEAMEEHRRRLATLQTLLKDAEQRGEAADGVEARVRAAEGEVARAEREAAALRGKVAAAERALPADLRDDDEA